MAIMPKIRISGPLAPYVGGAWSYLLAQGYTPLVSQCKLRLASQLSRWLVDAGVRLSALTREHVEAFFGERRQAGYRSNVTPRSLSSILRYLEEKGVVSLLEAVVQRSAVDDLLDEYEQFLVKERGLQASTVRSYYRSYAKKFLSHRFDSNSLELSCLSANDITGFILQESETSSVNVVLTVVGFGQMNFKNGKYAFKKKPVNENPEEVTVTSTGGGSDTLTVRNR